MSEGTLEERWLTLDPNRTIVGYTFGGEHYASPIMTGLTPADVVRMLPRGSEAIGVASYGTSTDPLGGRREVRLALAANKHSVDGVITYLDTGHSEGLSPDGNLVDVIRKQLTYY